MLVLSAAVGLVAVAGCGARSGGTADDPWNSNVSRVARLVERYRIAKRGALPSSMADLQSFATAMDRRDLEALGIADAAGCFVSERDGKPIELVTGSGEIVCHEQEGRDGTRLVGRMGGDAEAVDAARFSELVPARQAKY